MHRSLIWLIRGQQRYWGLGNVACTRGLKIQGNVTHMNPVTAWAHSFGTKQSFDQFVEEDTISHKVLEHMRNQSVYSGISKFDEKTPFPSSVFGDKYAVKQLLIVISHSTHVKVDDILRLFSLYALSVHYVTQDVISDKHLVNSAFAKVSQSLHLMKHEDLQQLALYLRRLDFRKNSYLSRLARDVAVHSEHLALESNFVEALKLFNILLILFGNRVYKKSQFDSFMSIFEANIDTAQPYDLVQIIHYVGLAKNKKFAKEYAQKAIKRLEPHFHALSFTDAGIAAGGIFKTGLMIDNSSIAFNSMVKQLKSKLEDAHVNDELESYGIVAMIKLLRLAKYQDGELTSVLSAFILQADDFLSPQVVPHILAFYANSRFYNQDIFSKLEESIIDYLTQANRLIRVRDLTRLLWCFSRTGHKFSPLLYTKITEYLKKNLLCREVSIEPHLLSDALLSLAVFELYPKDLIEYAFQASLIMGLKGYQRSKQLSRLLMLSECLRIEAPELTAKAPAVSPNELPIRTLTDEITHRPTLAKIWEGAKLLNDILGVQAFKLKFVVPYINYASLILDTEQLNQIGKVASERVTQQEHILQQLHSVREKTRGEVALELLDSEMLLQESLQPVGMIQLKLRLMRKTGWNVTEVYFNEIEDIADIRTIAALIIDKVIKCN